MPPKKVVEDDSKSLVSAGGATVATAATGDTKLSAASLKSGSAQIEMDSMLDDVSVLGMEQGSIMSAGVAGSIPNDEGDARIEKEYDDEGQGGHQERGGEGGGEFGESSEEDEGNEGEGRDRKGDDDDATKISGLTKESGDRGGKSDKKKGGGLGGFFKRMRGKTSLPKVTSARRFSVDGIKVFAKKIQEDEEEMKIDPYMPAVKFHERMSRRREKFQRKKEEVAEIVNNAEHNKFSLGDNMKTY